MEDFIMVERINYNNGYYYGDVTTKYINGSFMKVKHGFGTYYWNSGERLEATYMDDNPLNGKYYFKDGIRAKTFEWINGIAHI